MFRGESSLNIDAKGRIAVPARYRERLSELCAGRVVITISLLCRSLTVYPFPDWQQIESALKNLPALDQAAQAIRHLLIGHANECEMDGQGRLLIPQSLREFASLDKQVKLVGQGTKFELWDDAAWARRREELLGQVDSLLAEPSEALRALVL
jgi:MraZ protein